jgi:hypothetical protein
MVEVNARQYDLCGDQDDDDPLQLVALLVIEDLEEELGVALDVRDLVLDLAEPDIERGREKRQGE